MRSLIFRLLAGFATLVSPVACVDSLDQFLRSKTDVVVVDGRLTNLPEAQIIQLNRARPDSVTGRFGFSALTRATVEVVVDSAQVIACHETTNGRYQLPSDFRGQVGHAYQLRFTLSNGQHYQSPQQVMPPVPTIDKVTLRFNPISLPLGLLEDSFRAGFDVFINTQDPVNQRNYYRWDWNLYEKQNWCQSCSQGYYMPNKLKVVSSYPSILIYQTQADLLEDCFAAPADALFGGAHEPTRYFETDYVCRTQCWDIIHSSELNLFSDENSNGGLITNRNVGQVPYYTQNPALVEVRQSSLTMDAYRYTSLLQKQTQNTGGLADTPPTALVGNVQNVSDPREPVVGYFTTEAVSSTRYWLDKKDHIGLAYGGAYYDIVKKIFEPVPGEQQLFFAFHRKLPQPEGSLNFTILGGVNRPPTAVCVPSDDRTPFKPVGWRD